MRIVGPVRSKSLPDTSALLPTETKLEIPIGRRVIENRQAGAPPASTSPRCPGADNGEGSRSGGRPHPCSAGPCSLTVSRQPAARPARPAPPPAPSFRVALAKAGADPQIARTLWRAVDDCRTFTAGTTTMASPLRLECPRRAERLPPAIVAAVGCTRHHRAGDPVASRLWRIRSIDRVPDLRRRPRRRGSKNAFIDSAAAV